MKNEPEKSIIRKHPFAYYFQNQQKKEKNERNPLCLPRRLQQEEGEDWWPAVESHGRARSQDLGAREAPARQRPPVADAKPREQRIRGDTGFGRVNSAGELGFGHDDPGSWQCLGGGSHAHELLTVLGRQDLLDVVDNVAVELGGGGRKGLLGKGLGHLAATHHGTVQRKGVFLFPLQETQARSLSGLFGGSVPPPGPKDSSHGRSKRDMGSALE